MITLGLLSALVVPFLAALLLVPLVRTVALRRGWVDAPDGERKRHAAPTPNVGGVAIAGAVGIGLVSLLLMGDLLALTLSTPVVIVGVGALIILATGFYDDVRGLGFKQKFMLQAAVAYLLMHAGYHVEVANLPFMAADPYQQTLYTVPLTMLWIVGILNAVNLLDGLDGLAPGVVMIAFVCLASIFGLNGDVRLAALALLMVGALAGFLIYNFNPASIFMGDSGSLFLGYTLAITTLSLGDGAHANPMLGLLVPVIVLGLPLLDTGLCITRRLLEHRSPFAPDHDHIHHRLSRLLPQRRAVLLLYGIALWCGIAAVSMTLVDLPTGVGVVIATFITAYVGVRALGYVGPLRAARRAPLAVDLAFDEAAQGEAEGHAVGGDGASGSEAGRHGPPQQPAAGFEDGTDPERRPALELEL
ncbi:MAG: MraY family glycosyltransferase [Rhodothermales bacterium]|nr:MraY family glycosyltransferase [Rhodothermales bacterium]